MTSEGMGYLFEELIKQFNEENSLESGEHYTPKDVIELMTKLLFNPVKHLIQDKTYTVYDCTSGTGGSNSNNSSNSRRSNTNSAACAAACWCWRWWCCWW